MNVFLNTFRLLCRTKFGREASRIHGIPPYVDGSCRREPDFENEYPAITEICRPGKILYRLKPGDLIIYLTVKDFYGEEERHWKLISILEVLDKKNSHAEAEASYIEIGTKVSQNLICNSTAPLSYDMTAGWSTLLKKAKKEASAIRMWDYNYKVRSDEYANVAITNVWNGHNYLIDPPKITEESMLKIFGRFPGTRSGYKMRTDEWENFQNELRL